jgi:putative transposase
MRPDAPTNQAFLYCLGVAAQRTNVRPLFALAMSNHYHAGIIDTDGRLPEFLERFHRMFAKHQNALRGRRENFWAAEQTSVISMEGEEDVIDKLLYSLANPVAGHLVARTKDWPGASSFEATREGRPIVVDRPETFFAKKGEMPDRITLEFARPPGMEHLSQDEFRRVIDDGIADREKTAARERTERRLQVLGRDRVLKQRWWDGPKTVEPRRRFRPRVASKNRWRKVEALRRDRAFVEAYRSARDAWLAGTVVEFPSGTYWLRRFAGVRCSSSAA